MLLASKAALPAIVFILLSTGISGPRPAPVPSGANLTQEEPAVWSQNDVGKMQDTLRDKGHYRGKVDGLFGLRTQASIRAFQGRPSNSSSETRRCLHLRRAATNHTPSCFAVQAFAQTFS